MKTLISYIILLLFISCSKSSNSEAFIEKAQGRYLYNSDEIVEVYFKNNELFLKWRGATTIKPLKVAENTFFVKEMNEKIQFLDNPINSKTYMALVPKESIDSLTYDYRKLADNEKIPSEYFAEKEFDKALKAYITIQKNDSLDPAIDEGNFNRIGYNKLRDKNFEEALEVFKINMKLHPESSNVYDSYADALKRSGDTITAIEYYKKSLAIDSGNRSAKEFVEKYDVKE